MARVVIKRKGDFAWALVFFIGGVLSFGYYAAGFPQEQELQYYSGKLDTFEVNRGDSKSSSSDTLLIFYDKNTKSILEFSCSYSSLGHLAGDDCGSNAELQPYIGKVVTVGWYQRDYIVERSNSRPQMVTLSSEGTAIRSYEQTLAMIESDKKASAIFVLISTLFSIFIYWFYGKHPQQ